MSEPLRLYPIRSVTLDYFPWESVPGDRRGRNVARMQIASLASGTAAVSVSDSTGRVVRRWETAITKGVNTLTWDLQAERDSSELADAAAGSFTVNVRVGDSRATGRVRVLPDPILQRR